MDGDVERRIVKPGEPYDPPALFRYMSLEPVERFEWARQVVQDSRIYFTAPTAFNDPFDCRVVIQNDGTEEEWVAVYLDELRKHGSGMPQAEIEARAKAAAVDVMAGRGRETLIRSLQADVYGCGICCFSERPDDPLMWAHYAGCHRGICLAFSHRNEPFLGRAQKVRYSVELPEVGFLHNSPGDHIDAHLLSKSVNWSYEQEWRIVDTESGPGVKRFPPSLLEGILLGARIREEHRRRVCSWARGRNPQIPVHQARLHSSRYELEWETVFKPGGGPA